jgi:hypothetical protein
MHLASRARAPYDLSQLYSCLTAASRVIAHMTRNALTLQRSREEHYHTVLKGAIDGNTARHSAVVLYLKSLGAHEHSLHGAAQTGNVAIIQELVLANPGCLNDTNRRAAITHHAASHSPDKCIMSAFAFVPPDSLHLQWGRFSTAHSC